MVSQQFFHVRIDFKTKKENILKADCTELYFKR